MRILCAVIVGWFIVVPGAAQRVDMPHLASGDIPGLEVTQTGHFDGNALFGYMDGGAELYREFGFVDLTVQEMRIGEHQLLVELFRMRDSLAAFGIFSVSRGECSGDDTSAVYWCSSPGQALCAKGCYFFRVQRLTGESEGKGLADDVGRRLLRLLPDSEFILLPWCPTSPKAQTWQRKATLVRGPLGLQNSLPDWMDALEPGGYSTITIVNWTLGDTPVTLGWIQCVSEGAASALEQFISAIKRPGWRYIKRCATDAFLVVEADLPADKLARFADQILNSP
jgi:hypothetical protein